MGQLEEMKGVPERNDVKDLIKAGTCAALDLLVSRPRAEYSGSM